MYECHITVEAPKEHNYLKALLKEELPFWKYSAIDGDPVLGKGVKCYATRHYSPLMSIDSILIDLHTAALRIKSAGYEVLREKIEIIIYDTKRI